MNTINFTANRSSPADNLCQQCNEIINL